MGKAHLRSHGACAKACASGSAQSEKQAPHAPFKFEAWTSGGLTNVAKGGPCRQHSHGQQGQDGDAGLILGSLRAYQALRAVAIAIVASLGTIDALHAAVVAKRSCMFVCWVCRNQCGRNPFCRADSTCTPLTVVANVCALTDLSPGDR
jgi:hypothetical protein